jgi:hypothetical protein
MSSLMDRLQKELEQLGKNAQEALEEGKTRVRVLRLERQRDNAARDLGMLTWRKERGGEVDARRIESLLFRLDDLDAEIARAKAEAGSTAEPTADVTPPPPPASW